MVRAGLAGVEWAGYAPSRCAEGRARGRDRRRRSRRCAPFGSPPTRRRPITRSTDPPVAALRARHFRRARRGAGRRHRRMEPRMRRLIAFACEGETLAASLDDGDGARPACCWSPAAARPGSVHTGCTKGSPRHWRRRAIPASATTGAGSATAAARIPAFAAAARISRPPPPLSARRSLPSPAWSASACATAQPRSRSLADEAGLDGLILVNPWLVEAEEGAPPRLRSARHYRKRLLSREGWKRLLTGAVNFRKLWRGIRSLFVTQAGPKACPTTWPGAAPPPAAHRAHPLPRRRDRDRGRRRAAGAWPFEGLIRATQVIESDSHTFARPGDDAALLATVEMALGQLSEDGAQAS